MNRDFMRGCSVNAATNWAVECREETTSVLNSLGKCPLVVQEEDVLVLVVGEERLVHKEPEEF